jgi:GT2 family glycosyltransferase
MERASGGKSVEKSVKEGEGLCVSVIVPVYNDPIRLARCLSALEDQTYSADYEVIVVDNGSDKSPSPIVSNYPFARLCHEQKEGSYAARNHGIALAKGEVIAFTDADCIPASDWIERGVEQLQSAPKSGLIGGRVEITYQDSERLNAAELYESARAFKQKAYINRAHFSVTANLFTRKEVLETVGVFDEDLKSGGDYEWGNRVFRAGYELAYGENVEVEHPARSSVWALVKKERRVWGGLFKKDLEKRSRWEKVTLAIHAFRPPVRALQRVFFEDEIDSVSGRMKVAGIVFMLRYVQAIECLRVTLGGAPAR